MNDESELLRYRSRLERWETQQEEKKHVFTITQDDLPSSRGSKTAPPFKGGTVSVKLFNEFGILEKLRRHKSSASCVCCRMAIFAIIVIFCQTMIDKGKFQHRLSLLYYYSDCDHQYCVPTACSVADQAEIS